MLAGCGSGGKLSPARHTTPQARGLADYTPGGMDLGQGAGGQGGGGVLDNYDPNQDPFETTEWPIVPFTDPRTGETYDIIDGRVIVALTNCPQLPQMPFDYFDVERPPTDPYYAALQAALHPCTNDPAVRAFVEAEHLQVFNEWPAVGAIAVVLPPGGTVLDAVTRWPQQYPAVVEVADPDAVVETTSHEIPNDIYFPWQWALDDTLSIYNIHWLEAWQAGYHGNSNIIVAVLDSGVEYHLVDLRGSSTPGGCNVYDKWKSTCFFPRTVAEGGGEPCLLTQSRDPEQAGHGTCVASILAAIANNRGPGNYDGTEIAGVASCCTYYPIGMKFSGAGGKYSTSTTLNAVNAVGCTKGIFDEGNLFSGVDATFYNIKVANCSYGSKAYNSTVHRIIKALSYYILFVCSAGNRGSGVRNDYPGALTAWPDLSVMSVAAYDENGDRSIWAGGQSSNYAPNTTIAAPGSDILALDLMGYCGGRYLGWQDNPDTVYEDFKGTSAAVPFVSGAAALVMCYHPVYTPAQVKIRLTTTSLLLHDPDFRNRGINGVNVMGSL
jgi:subtilisin family serine protease